MNFSFQTTFSKPWELCCEWYSDSRLNIPLSCSSVANLVVFFCGIIELLAEMNGQLTERRETEFVEKRRKKKLY